jgi:hypothetical protein
MLQDDLKGDPDLVCGKDNDGEVALHHAAQA